MKKIFTSVLTSLILLISLNSAAAERYWVGGPGSWNSGNHWALTSGGNPDGQVPDMHDDVVFDNNSGLENGAVTLSGSVSCKTLEVASTFPFVINGESQLYVYGSFVLNDLVKFEAEGSVIFKGSLPVSTVNFAGNYINADIEVDASSNKILLSGALLTNGDINLVSGELNTNGQIVKFAGFTAGGSQERTLRLGNSKLYISESFDLTETVNFNFYPGTSYIRQTKFADGSKVKFGNHNYYKLSTPSNNPTPQSNVCDYSAFGGPIINLTSSSTQSTCFNSDDATATVNVTVSGAGCGTTTVLWNDPANQTTTTATNLSPGTYTVTVTCTANPTFQCDDDVIVTEPAAVRVNQINITPPTCFGACNGAATATAGGGTSPRTLTWFSGNTATGASIATGPSVTGLCSGQFYTLHVEDSRGCFKDSTFFIPNPTQIQPNIAVVDVSCNGFCNGTATSLPTGGAGAPYSFSWNTTPAETTAGIDSLCPGSYTVTVTDVSGCFNTQTITVSEPPPLNATVVTTNATCNALCNGTASFTTSGGTSPYSYAWSPAGPTGSNPTDLCAGNYTVTVTDSNGCFVNRPVNITQPAPVPVNAGLHDTICNGGSAFLTASGAGAGGSYTWNPGNFNTISITVSPSTTTIYTVTGTNASNCTNTDTVLVLVNPLPPITASNDVTICQNSSTTLTATGGVSYQWSPTTGLVPSTGASVTATPSATTTYTVTGTDANGCVNTDEVIVNILLAPIVTAGNDDAICAGECTPLNAGGAINYNWNPITDLSNPNSSNPLACPTATTTYTVTGTDAVGCTNTDAVIITVNPLPIADAGTDEVACLGTCVSLTATGGGIGGTYVWNPITFLNNPAIANPLSCATNTITYTVTVTNANGCVDTDDVIVTINPLPPVDAGPDTAVCAGDCAPLNATGANVYTWNPNSTLDDITIENPNACPITTSTYTVTGSDNNGCVNTDQVIVTVNPLPTVTAGADTAICLNDCALLSASGANVYTWNPQGTIGNPNAATTVACPTATTTYTVTGTSAAACVNTDDKIVTVNPLPVITAGSDQVICVNGCVNLNATGAGIGGSYSWTPLTGLSNAGISNPQACPTATTTYTVTGTNANDCINTDIVIVNVNTLPPLAVTPVTQTICSGASATIIASGADGYSWLPVGGTAASITVSPSTTTTYTVTGTTASSGCTDTAYSIVNVLPLPVVTVSPTSANMCLGDSIQLTASGGQSYTWFPGNTLSSTSGNPVIAFPSITTTYTVTGTGSNSCTKTATSIITVIPKPTITITPLTATICPGGSVTLSATGAGIGGTYSWNPAGSGTTITVSPSVTSTYTVTGTGANGCFNTDTVIVNVNSVPNVFISSTSSTTCSGVSVTLTGNGASSYVWQPGGSNAASITVSPTTTSTYTVTGTSGPGCVNTDTIVISVNPLPVVNVTASNQAICLGSSATLTANGANTYTWNPGGPGASIVVAPLVTTTYTVTGSSSLNCIDTAKVVVTVNPLPVIDAGSNQAFCIPGSANLNASGAGIGGTYSWNTADLGLSNYGISNPVATPSATTTYTVTGTNVNGCTSTDTAIVSVNSIMVNAGNDKVLCAGDSVQLNVVGGATFTWSPSSSLINANSSSPIAFPTTTTTYTVTSVSGAGCSGTDQVIVDVHALGLTVSLTDPTGCTTADGEATANPSGGSGSYTYSWSCSPSLGQSITGLTDGGCNVLVTDSLGCTAQQTFILNDPSGVTVNPVTNQPVVCGGNGDITVNPSGGVGPFSFSWTGPVTGSSNTITGPAGVYFVTINDNGTNCNTTFTDTLNNPAPLPISAGNDTSVCPGSGLVLTASGGFSSYTWTPAGSISGSNLLQSVNAIPSTNTAYTVVGTDGNNCTSTDNVTVSILANPVANAGVDQAVCPGTLVQLTGSGAGIGGSYEWNPAAGMSNPNSANPSVTVNATSTFTLTITNSSGCTDTDEMTVSIAPMNLATIGSINTQDVSTCGGSDGSLDLNVTGGIPPYTYSWTGTPASFSGATTQDISGLTVGIYTVLVTDSTGCSASLQDTINEPAAFLLSINSVNTSSCTTTDGSITLTVNGGTGPYDVVWTGPTVIPNQTLSTNPQTFTGLAPGSYSVVVTEQGTGCSSVTSANVSSPSPTLVNAGADVTMCLGDTLNLTASPSTGTFNWTPGTFIPNNTVFDPQVSPVATTTYTVSYTDVNNCNSTDQVIVDVTNMSVSVTSTNTTSCNGTDGTITATVSNGTFPFTYTLDPGAVTQTNPVFSNVSFGVYTVTVTDQTGCTGTATNITISDPVTFAISTVVSNSSSCNGATGAIDLTVSGGTGPFNYTWTDSLNNVIATTEDISSLSAGAYTVAVSDGLGCGAIVTDTVQNPLPVQADAGSDITICENDSFQLTSTANGVSYNWNPVAGLSCTTCSNPIASPLVTTSYSLTITDANGCTSIDTVIVNVNPIPVISAGADQSMCPEGSALLQATGTATSFLWSPAAGLDNTSINNPVAEPTATTTYTVTGYDNIGCYATDATIVSVNTITINSNTTSPSTCAAVDGSIDLTVSPASGNSFSWTGPATFTSTSEDISGLVAGLYHVVITNNNGCSDSLDVLLNDNSALTLSTNVIQPSGCVSSDGSIDLTVSGSNGPITYSWTGPGSFTAASEDISNLATGTYFVSVTDSAGCTAVLSETLTSSNSVQVDAGGDTTMCAGSSVQLNATQNGVSYSWTDPGNTLSCNNCPNPIAFPVTSTNYVVTMVDVNGCVSTDNVTVTISNLSLGAAVTDVSSCGAQDGVINLNISGGVGNYTYSWTSTNGFTAVTEDLVNLEFGVYTVFVSDSAGCSQTLSVPVNQPSNLTITSTVIQPTTCSPGTEGSISLNVTGGSGTYSYQWFGGSTATTDSIGGLMAGLYNVTVTDVISGCISGYSVTLDPVIPNTVYAGADARICSGGSVTLSATSGFAAYTWNPGGNSGMSFTASPASTSTYTVTATDSKGCESTDNVVVEITSLAITASVNQPTDCFINNGSIDLSVSNGTAPYSYSWTPGGQTTQDIVSITAGHYTVYVTNQFGCDDSLKVDVISLTPVIANAGPDSVFCQGGAVTLDGGASTPNVTYTWTSMSTGLVGNTQVVTLTPALGTTDYVLSVTNGTCSDVDTVEITSNVMPFGDAGTDKSIIVNTSVTIGGNPSGPAGSLFTWTPSFGMSDSTVANPVVTPLLTTTYTLTVVNESGCIGIDSMVVTVLPEIIYPTGFTPNGDGKNETWIIDNIDLFPNCTVEVYNRWGEQLFYSEGYKTPWDGTYKGEALPVGTYYYIIKLNDDRFPDPYTGPVTIIR